MKSVEMPTALRLQDLPLLTYIYSGTTPNRDGDNGTTPMEMKEMVTTASTEDAPTPAGEMTGLTEHLRNEQRQYNLRNAPRLPHASGLQNRGAGKPSSAELSPRSNRYLSR